MANQIVLNSPKCSLIAIIKSLRKLHSFKLHKPICRILPCYGYTEFKFYNAYMWSRKDGVQGNTWCYHPSPTQLHRLPNLISKAHTEQQWNPLIFKSPNRKLSELNCDVIITLLHTAFMMAKVFSYIDSKWDAFLLGRDKIFRVKTRI